MVYEDLVNEGDFIKRTAILLCALMIVGIISGCGKIPLSETVTGETASPLSVYREFDGLILKLGDTREYVEKSIGPDERLVTQFEEDNTERVEYYDSEGIQVDFDADGKLYGIWMGAEGWKIENGLVVGNSVEDIKTIYGEDKLYKHPDSEDLWVAYDKDGNLIDFTREEPYLIRFNLENGIIKTIIIMDNAYLF